MNAAGLAVMISGGGRTLLNLADRIESGSLRGEIRVVIASKMCLGAERARERGLAVLVVPGVIEPGVLGRILRDHGAEWIVLGGYVKYLRVPRGFEGRAVNIHPALLPSFGGRGMYGERVHRTVLEAGCKVSGCTVHLVDEEYDHGPIVAQRACEVREDDTAGTLGERVFGL
jgi:folate-dependent phosphoribosylglycinamide formyltransferase PurN